MHRNLEFFLHGLYVLARRSQNGHQDRLSHIAHAIVSYQLKGDSFLERNRRKDGPKFVHEHILPRLRGLKLNSLAEKELLLTVASRFLEAESSRCEVVRGSSLRWEEFDFVSTFERKVVKKAQAMSI